MSPPPVNPKDSMKSTWRTNRAMWWLPHYAIDFLGAHPNDLDKDVPVFDKSTKVPIFNDWSIHLWILAHAIWPILLQYAYTTYSGHPMGPLAVFLLYLYAMRINAIHEVNVLRKLGHQYGFFDGDKSPRDQVPDNGVAKAFLSVQLTTAIRPLMTVALAANSGEPSLTWWLPVEIGLYSVILDFWFYTYHRACHEISALWKYHRTHHLTKHPTVMLSAYADWQQETIEMAIIPILTFTVLRLIGLPMGFHDWWICHEYLIFSEAFGHSGLRIFAIVPSTASPILRWFNCELVLEDHDLHHRFGWKKSHNYGKQTRLWDRIFGTCTDRIECHYSNIDLSRTVNLPFF
ncbi:hypothetical protein DV736_g2480, partial [Chaetothyriales sp. CBS 134916]